MRKTKNVEDFSLKDYPSFLLLSSLSSWKNKNAWQMLLAFIKNTFNLLEMRINRIFFRYFGVLGG